MSALAVLYLILPLPVAYLIHDAELFAVRGRWMSEQGLRTGGFVAAAFEELAVVVLVTLNVLVNGPLCVKIWSALFMAFSVHMILHAVKAVSVRGYVPGLVTAVILLVYAAMGLHSIWNLLSPVELILYGLTGVAVMALNRTFAMWLGRKLS